MTIKLTVNDNFMYFLNESGLKRSSNTKKDIDRYKNFPSHFHPYLVVLLHVVSYHQGTSQAPIEM